MGLLTFAGRIVLVVVNILFILVSLALIIGGFILRFFTSVIDLEETFKTINSASESLFSESVDTSNFDFGAMVEGLAIAMIVLGLVLLAFALFGCISACCNFTTLLLVYAIVLAVILLAQVIVVVLIFAVPDTFKGLIKDQARKTLDDYEGLRGESATSVGWNWASRLYDCCGVDNFHDFENKGTWKGPSGTADGTDVITPIVCCKELPSDTTAKEQCAGKVGTYDETAIAPNSNKDKGCVDKIWVALVDNKITIYITSIVICFLFQLALIVFAYLGYKDRGIKGGLI